MNGQNGANGASVRTKDRPEREKQKIMLPLEEKNVGENQRKQGNAAAGTCVQIRNAYPSRCKENVKMAIGQSNAVRPAMLAVITFGQIKDAKNLWSVASAIRKLGANVKEVAENVNSRENSSLRSPIVKNFAANQK